MRIRCDDGASSILGYCTNVHAVEDADAALAALGRFCGPVRRRLGAESLALGLWLSHRTVTALARSDVLRARFREELEANALELVTLNGFPYGDFHAERVKQAVYRPDWTDPRRSGYTLALARLLAECLPASAAEGTISTLPLVYRAAAAPDSVRRCAERLAAAAADLARLADSTGRRVRVCIEPEPDCVIETTGEAIAFFHAALRPAARRLGVPDDVVDAHLGVCFDACHQAVEFEDPVAAWRALGAAGVRVGKVQLSCALEVPAESSAGVEEALGPFEERRFLHQVRRRDGRGHVEGRVDLGMALRGEAALPRAGDWRVHFHVPLDWRPQPGPLRTTADGLLALLPAVAATRPLPHLEVETYTWSVLPEALRPRDDATLVEGIAREIAFAERALAAQGARRVALAERTAER